MTQDEKGHFYNNETKNKIKSVFWIKLPWNRFIQFLLFQRNLLIASFLTGCDFKYWQSKVIAVIIEIKSFLFERRYDESSESKCN